MNEFLLHLDQAPDAVRVAVFLALVSIGGVTGHWLSRRRENRNIEPTLGLIGPIGLICVISLIVYYGLLMTQGLVDGHDQWSIHIALLLIAGLIAAFFEWMPTRA